MINISDVAELPGEELTSIFRQGAVLRLPYLEGRLLRAQRQVEHFEEKHTTTLEKLKSQGLPDDAGYELHEDFIEWEYWDDVLRETEITIKNVRRILENVEKTIATH